MSRNFSQELVCVVWMENEDFKDFIDFRFQIAIKISRFHDFLQEIMKSSIPGNIAPLFCPDRAKGFLCSLDWDMSPPPCHGREMAPLCGLDLKLVPLYLDSHRDETLLCAGWEQLSARNVCHTRHIPARVLPRVAACVWLDCTSAQMSFRSTSIDMVVHRCVTACALSDCISCWMLCHNAHI